MNTDTIMQGDALAVRSHPAKFSASILPAARAFLRLGWTVIDPFAGVGGIHALHGCRTIGVELEREWAMQTDGTAQGDALRLPFASGTFDAAVTSPVYGNRVSDCHDARDRSRRITYRHTLGHALRPQNAGGLQWGARYRAFHRDAWAEVARVVKAGGRFILNVSDHIRQGRRVRVSAWHLGHLLKAGHWRWIASERVKTRRMGFGRNGRLRVGSENLYVLERLAESRLAPQLGQRRLF